MAHTFDAMIDLETLGTKQDSSIIALGVSVFDGRHFENREWTIKPDYDRAELSTLAWWREQPDGELFLKELETDFAFNTVREAFREASDTYRWHDKKTVGATRFWCRGMQFDFLLLEHQLQKVPWKYWQLNDLRTLHKAWGDPEGYSAPAAGVAHRAGEDAYEQNKLLQAIKGHMSQLKRGQML